MRRFRFRFFPATVALLAFPFLVSAQSQPPGSETAAGVPASAKSGHGFGVDAAGNVSATSVSGDGSGLTGVDAASLGGLGPTGYATKTELDTSGSASVHWLNLKDVPAGFADGTDDDTRYSAGFGVELVGEELRVAPARSAIPSAALTALAGTAVRDGAIGGQSSITTGADGLPVTAFLDAGKGGGLVVAHCADVVCSTVVANQVDPEGHGRPAIAIGSDGLPIVAYTTQADEVRLAFCDDSACASASLVPIDGNGSYPAVVVGMDGFPLIAYREESVEDLIIVRCQDARCLSIAGDTPVLTAAQDGYHASMTLGADGHPVISHLDGMGALNDFYRLNFTRCDDPACATATTINIGAIDYQLGATSIAIGADGNPVVAAELVSCPNGEICTPANNVSVLVCHDPLCLNADRNEHDPAPGGRRGEISLAIGADGLPLLSYFDSSNADLKVLHCADRLCGAATAVTAASANAVGAFSSLTIGVDGLGIVSFHDATSEVVRLLHCPNTFCVPHFRRR